jgi:ABC-type uncharacterized transport system permease subunit
MLVCACLQDLLTRHKQVVAQFLQDNFTRFFDAFSALLQSNNYVTRRQSLKVQLASSPLGLMHGKCRSIQSLTEACCCGRVRAELLVFLLVLVSSR